MVVCDIGTWDGMVTQRGTDFKLSVAARLSRSLEIVKPLGLGSLCAGLVKFCTHTSSKYNSGPQRTVGANTG